MPCIAQNYAVSSRRAAFALIGLIVCAATPLAAGADTRGCDARPSDGLRDLRVSSGGHDRPVKLYFPAGYRAVERLALVFDLHGSGSNGEQQTAASGLRAVADKHGFIVASPNGGIAFPAPYGGYGWNIPGVPLIGGVATPADAPDDVQFIADTIALLVADHCVDSRRVYATGISGGARMTSLLACRLSRRIAAVAPVAGLRAGTPDAADAGRPDPRTCRPERPVAILTFHGTGDETNPYLGGGEPYWRYSVSEALERWARIDGCRSVPIHEAVADRVTRTRYDGCREHTEVVQYLIDAPSDAGGGHVWPQARTGEAANDAKVQLDASEIIAEFFDHHVRD